MITLPIQGPTDRIAGHYANVINSVLEQFGASENKGQSVLQAVATMAAGAMVADAITRALGTYEDETGQIKDLTAHLNAIIDEIKQLKSTVLTLSA